MRDSENCGREEKNVASRRAVGLAYVNWDLLPSGGGDFRTKKTSRYGGGNATQQTGELSLEGKAHFAALAEAGK